MGGEAFAHKLFCVVRHRARHVCAGGIPQTRRGSAAGVKLAASSARNQGVRGTMKQPTRRACWIVGAVLLLGTAALGQYFGRPPINPYTGAPLAAPPNNPLTAVPPSPWGNPLTGAP